MSNKEHARNEENVKISVVVPAYNEEEVLPEFYRRLRATLNELNVDSEILFVNDGSTDRTLDIMSEMRNSDSTIAILDLSRNFGKEIALTAGIDHACGDMVVVIDADLQDPPELIAEFLPHIRNGYDVVYAKRTAREGESFLKKTTAHAFHRIMQSVGRFHIPEDTGDFRMMNHQAITALREFREQHRYMKGLFASIGFRQKEIQYSRDPRYSGDTKWSYWQLLGLAIDGITSFSIAPLKLASYLGFVTSTTAFVYAIYIIYKTIMFGDPVAGYPTIMVVLLFLGGIQLLCIGIVGEYVGRTYGESKNRPLYFVQQYKTSQLRDNA